MDDTNKPVCQSFQNVCFSRDIFCCDDKKDSSSCASKNVCSWCGSTCQSGGLCGGGASLAKHAFNTAIVIMIVFASLFGCAALVACVGLIYCLTRSPTTTTGRVVSTGFVVNSPPQQQSQVVFMPAPQQQQNNFEKQPLLG